MGFPQVIGKLAKERDKGFVNYISTDNVSRDLLQINEAASQAKRQYWGFSYGTVFGSIFATMFPARSHFLGLSIGVLDMDRYYYNDWWENTVDADPDMQSFSDGCLTAGLDRCAFYSPITAEISNKLDSLYESLLARSSPLILQHHRLYCLK
ncbi:hypothetical protein IW262DRAFT_1282284 [Armillaria fumosa]|nr:hypothetical protein IW262DRAFT_1282284 [Armillaria fumosa]